MFDKLYAISRTTESLILIRAERQNYRISPQHESANRNCVKPIKHIKLSLRIMYVSVSVCMSPNRTCYNMEETRH